MWAAEPGYTGWLGHVMEFGLHSKGKTKPVQGLMEDNVLVICLYYKDLLKEAQYTVRGQKLIKVDQFESYYSSPEF